MISENIASEIRRDFNVSPDQEMLPISVGEAELFWDWFRKCSELTTVDVDLPPRINDKSLLGQCYANSQFEAVNNNCDYCEGFMKVKGHFYYHAYNVSLNRVVDVTANEYFIDDVTGLLPIDYYGIIIPNDLIWDINGEAIDTYEKNRIKPLLKTYWERTWVK